MNKYLIGLALFVSGLAHGVLGTLALAPVPTPIQVECPCKCGKPEVSPKPVKPAGDLPPQGFGASPPLGAVEPRCNCHPCTCGKTCRCDWIATISQVHDELARGYPFVAEGLTPAGMGYVAK